MRLRDWYVTVLEGRVVYQDPILCFITYDDEHHRIAIGALPGVEQREPGLRVGLHHTAFTYYRDPDGPEELIARYEAGEPLEALRQRSKLPPGKTPLDMMRE